MANLPAAKKSIRRTKRKTSRNNRVRTRLEKARKKAQKLIQLGEQQLAEQQLQKVFKIADKAAKNNVVHPNRAARIKSRLTKKVNSIKKDVKTAQKNS